MSVEEASDIFRSDIAQVLEIIHIHERIEAWLQTFEGRKLPAESAQGDIRNILDVVDKANLQLVLEGKPVTLYVDSSTEPHAKISVHTIGVKPPEKMRCLTPLPRLSVRPKP